MERIIVDRTVEKYREELQVLRLKAEQARKMIGETELEPQFQEDLVGILHIALAYQPSQGPSSAIYALAQITDRLQKLLHPWKVITDYDRMHEKLREFEVLYG